MFDTILKSHGNDKVGASIEVAQSLAAPCPSGRQPYTAENAALAVCDLYGLSVNEHTEVCVSLGVEHIARNQYGDDAVDNYFREVEGIDPDAMRAEV